MFTASCGWLQGGHLRKCADTLGRVADVPHLDVGGGDREDQTGGRTIFDWHHVVWVAFEGDDLLACYQVPHLTGTIWKREEGQFKHSAQQEHSLGCDIIQYITSNRWKILFLVWVLLHASLSLTHSLTNCCNRLIREDAALLSGKFWKVFSSSTLIITKLNQTLNTRRCNTDQIWFITGAYDSLDTLDQLCQFLTAGQEMRESECCRWITAPESAQFNFSHFL